MYRISISLTLFWVAFGFPLAAQPVVCGVDNSDSQPLVVRSEGLAELIGDIVLRCTGGEPTVPGRPVPSANIRIRLLNTGVANPVLAGGASDALLLFDDPPIANQLLDDFGRPATLTGVNHPCPSAPAAECGINFSNPSAPENRGQRVPNVFQGRTSGSTDVVWLGIPFDPPGTIATRIIRITNVRANADLLQDAVGAFIRGEVSSNQFTLQNPIVDLASILPGLQLPGPGVEVFTGVTGARTLNQIQDLNPGLPAGTIPEPNFVLRFVEGAANSFRTRSAVQGNLTNPFPAPADQAMPGERYPSETGFYNSAFPNQLGLAGYGTRFAANFQGVPLGTRIFVSNASDQAGSSPSVQAVVIGDCVGDARPAPATNGLVEVPVRDRAGIVCFEVIRQSAALREIIAFNAFVSFSGVPSTQSLGAIAVSQFLYPVAAVPPGRKVMGTSFPVFGLSPDPLGSTLNTFIAGLLNPVGISGQDQLQLARTPAFADGTIEAAGPTARRAVNVFVGSSRASRNVTITPILRSTPGAAREATVGWLSTTPTQTATPLTLHIEANPAGLAPGTYEAGVRLESSEPTPLVNEIPVRLIVPPAGPRLAVNGVGGAADYLAGAVAPGQAIVLFGAGFGPPELAELQLNETGRVATTLAGVRVLFDGLSAPMIYAATGQVSAFVPFAVAGRVTTEVRVEHLGVPSPPVFLRVLPAIPSIFTLGQTGSGQGAILNQDFSVNGESNPAAPGDIVLLYGTGAGQTDPPGMDGRVAAAPLPVLTQPVRVLIDGLESQVVYAGPAPELAEGVLQVNARLPGNVQRGQNVEVILIIGELRSQPGVTLAVRP